MTNPTMVKYDYPNLLLGEYKNWVVMLRPTQVTLGSLMLASKLDATRFSDLPVAAFAELPKVTGDIESVLKRLFAYDRINYLLFMMIDREVHFHVLPRYESERAFGGVTFTDSTWPKPPDFTKITALTPEQRTELLSFLRKSWPTSLS